MDLSQRKYAVVLYLSLGKFVDEEILFPGREILSAVNNGNTYQYLGTHKLFKLDLRNGHY